MPALQLIGYWRGSNDREGEYPHPTDWVDWAWAEGERATVGWYFSTGTLLHAYMGLSMCRICGRPNGSAEYTDGTYVWPEGLAHYVDEHGVRLPEEVVSHALSRSETLETYTVSSDWWRTQRSGHGASVTSASSVNPELMPCVEPTGARSAVTHYPGEDDAAEDRYLEATSVWIQMAKILNATGGPKILKASMRGAIADGLAEVTWSEVHDMTEEEYRALVEKAREIAD